MKKSKNIFLATVLSILAIVTAHSCFAKDEVILIIDKTVYQACEENILRYKADVEARFPVDLTICNEAAFESYTPQQIRSYLQTQYQTKAISGAILAGQIAYREWEQSWPWDNSGINSNYYEDLDGTFVDENANGKDDYHGWGTKVGPEIWCCWMRPPANNNINSLNAFLSKTHDYYTGKIAFNHRAIICDHTDFDNDIRSGFDQYGHLSKFYGTSIDVLGEGDALADGDEYVTKLRANRYEISDTMAHAYSEGHWFDGKYVFSDQIANCTGGAIISLVYGCHSAAFNESPSNNLVQMYAFGKGIGQAAAGTSWSYGMGEKYAIYDVLYAGGYLGQGWLAMQKLVNSPTYLHQCYQNDVDVNRQMWGQNLLGNPFIYTNFSPESGIKGTVSGKVTDRLGSPIKNAIVGFKSDPKATADALVYTITDENGCYTASDIQDGVWVAAWKDGYIPSSDLPVTITTENGHCTMPDIVIDSEGINLALKCPHIGSSGSATGMAPAKAVDADMTTSWTTPTSPSGTQYFYIDLGAQTNISDLVLYRYLERNALGDSRDDYKIEVMTSPTANPLTAANWTNPANGVSAVYTATNTIHGYEIQPQTAVDAIALSLTGVRGIRIGFSNYHYPRSYSIKEVQVHKAVTYRQVSSIADLKNVQAGEYVVVSGKTLTALPGNGIPTGVAYVEDSDRSSGIRLDITGFPNSTAVVGDTVNVKGLMSTTYDKEKSIQVTGWDYSTGKPVKPFLMNIRALGGAQMGTQDGLWYQKSGLLVRENGLNNIGLLVKVCGRVTQISSYGYYFYIDDGSGIIDGTKTGTTYNIGVRISVDGRSYSPGQFITVTGISSCFNYSEDKIRKQIRPISIN